MTTFGTPLSGARSCVERLGVERPVRAEVDDDRIAEQVRLTELLEDRHHVDHLAADVGVDGVAAAGQAPAAPSITESPTAR